MIRVVFDANVLVSGIPAKSGSIADVVNRWKANAFELAICAHSARSNTCMDQLILAFSIVPVSDRQGSDLLETDGLRVELSAKVQGVATHPQDDVILAAAVSAQADCS